ncbi:polysaccharide deacetylase family protein [Planomonospora sp. ID91781]|uniref:Chitin deacetylase n=1 Tax=Planomonospora sphaerica TaxID=161355 RepID=A0A171CZY9_9ACTN|nr:MULTISPECIES: polysaccharide deacetylase family protein [Planomonospora]MBG0825285.1 polysaccharide deacetylase family protein [Planomonospora sp. ID91781]GAT67482.1 chitin deacetylase [Planomonospora sphaerica]
MRLWAAPIALLLGIGSPVPPPPDPETLARDLTEIQPQWPAARFPVPPAARKVDCARTRCVALTFDDGPGEYTGPLLDTLAAHRARATFFVIGRTVADGDGADLRRMVAEGHELGNHSWSHADLTGLPEDGIEEELRRTQEAVRRVTGVRMAFMRPPYGATDRRVASTSRREGLAQILWNVDTLDWLERDGAALLRRAGGAEPGSIVLMHDIHRVTVETVPALLEDLAARGYTFVTLSELYGRALTPGRAYLKR